MKSNPANPLDQATSQSLLRSLSGAPRPTVINLQVRPARREDSTGIATVHVKSWQAAYVGLFTPAYLASLSIADREQSWTGILDTSASSTFVVSVHDVVVGFVSFGHCRDQGAPRDQGEVWALYVTPDHWSTGAGWALWEAARVRMLHHGLAEVSLWVLSGNTRGLQFYGSIGFVVEAGSQQSFERGGTKLQEVRLRFHRMSANPSIERTSSSTLRLLPDAAHVTR